MYIKQLEIDNFKSFANKSEIPLLRGFTTISGPNGSGKSSIIDSVLFALGLASASELRAENLSQFISTYTKRNEAMVKVTFGDLNGGDDLAITRKIRKSSQGYASTYYINDSVSTLTNIHELLEKYNVTPSSYNVMMQHDVIGITECSTKQRRKIIDEVAGVADFDRKIDKAKNELETVKDRVEKSKIILNEVDTMLEQLNEEREIALKYQKLKNEKNLYESQVNVVNFFDIKRKLEIAHENILANQKKKKETENEQKILKEKLEQVRQEYKDISDKLKEEGEQQQINLKKDEQTIQGHINQKDNAFNFAEQQIHTNLISIENAKNGIIKFNESIAKNNENIVNTNKELDTLNSNIAQKNTELNTIYKDMTGLNKTADKYIVQLNEYKKDLDKYKDEEREILKNKLPLETEYNNLQKDIEQTEEIVDKLNKMIKSFPQDSKLKKELVQKIENELEECKILQKKYINDLDTTNNTLTDLDHDIRVAYRNKANIEAQKKAIEDISFGRAIETIMDAKLKGVHAPLVKLGTVDKEFSTAMEVAFGGRMAHIVVEDEHVASVAIEALRSSNAGRATFIPLNKVQQAPTKLHLPKDKGVIDFAINLVDFDDKYINAFFYAVGETLVVEDMECAKKLIGKYRMVTLQGELFEKSGSITGGSMRKNTLSFSQNDSEDLNKLNEKLTELENKYKTLQQKKNDYETKLTNIRKQYSDSLDAYNKEKFELDKMVEDFSNSENKLKEKEYLIKESNSKLATINKKLDKLENDNIENSQKILNLEDKIKEIENLLDDKDLKALKEKTKTIEDAIKDLENKKRDLEYNLKEYDRLIEFNKNLIETKNEEIEQTTKKIENLENDKIQFTKDKEKLNLQLNDIKKEIKIIEEKLQEFLQKRDEINEKIISLQTDENLKQSDLERIEEEIESCKTRRAELEPQLTQARKELEDNGVEINKIEPINISIEEIRNKIERLQRRMDELGDVNMKAITGYDEVLERQKTYKEQIETLTKEADALNLKMSEYEQRKKEVFMETYENINDNFKEVFHRLSEGKGELKLEMPNDPLSGGLTIVAQFRDKPSQRLEGLSGGEKALTALSFVFAIQKYLPAPFYALDEVDANLDTMNVERIAKMVQDQSKDTQFIVVSHRKPMIESANRTIGVTQKEKGITKVTGIKLRD